MKDYEHIEQTKLFNWLRLYSNRYKELDLIFAIPNESYGSGRYAIIRGRKLKAEGRRAGVPDIFVPIPSKGYSGMFIEMKRPKHLGTSMISKEQNKWLISLQTMGYKTVVCYGFFEAKNEILSYLNIVE